MILSGYVYQNSEPNIQVQSLLVENVEALSKSVSDEDGTQQGIRGRYLISRANGTTQIKKNHIVRIGATVSPTWNFLKFIKVNGTIMAEYEEERTVKAYHDGYRLGCGSSNNPKDRCEISRTYSREEGFGDNYPEPPTYSSDVWQEG